MSNFSIDGLASGLNTTDIIEKLMAAERQPLSLLEARKATFDARVAAWDEISARLATLRTSTADLATAGRLALFSASSSASSLLTATASASAAPGAATYRVLQLAAAHQVASAGAASAASVVGAGTATVVTGAPALGFARARADSSLTDGTHALEVRQASAAAAATGTEISFPVTITDTNKSLAVTVNGAARTVDIATGTYSSTTALAAAVEAALSVGGDVEVVADGEALTIATSRHGSGATLQITGGTALADLGLSVQGSPSTGTDAIVLLDDTTTTLSTIEAGEQLTLAGGSGSLHLTIGNDGLAAGTATVRVLRGTATTTLSDLAEQLGEDADGYTASVVNTGSGATPARLILNATATGAANAFSFELEGFTGIDNTATLVNGRDAKLQLGGLTLSRASNTVTDVLAGVTLDLHAADPSTDVTVTVSRDTAALTAKVKKFVDDLNTALKKVRDLTAYNAGTGRAATLTGDSRARGIAAGLQQAMQFTVDEGDLTSLSQLGISFQRDGTYAFNATKFGEAVAADFDGVVNLLSRTGEATDARVGFVAGSDETAAGTYAVSVTQAATQATVTGTPFGALSTNDLITVTLGGVSATYMATPPSTPGLVAAGLNEAFRHLGMGIEATIVGGAIVLTTSAFGSSAAFTVTSTGESGLSGSGTGTDVAGTINGQAATGSGQVLSSTVGASKGLRLRVTATAADVAGAGGSLALGSVDYRAGAGGGLAQALFRMTATDGVVDAAHDGAEASADLLGDRIEDYSARLEERRLRYIRQFANLETVLGQMKSQSQWLSSQIAAISANNQ